MLALCSQENPPTSLSILFNSEGPWPEFFVTVSGLMTCSSCRGFEPISRNFNPRIGPITPSRRTRIWREERRVQGNSVAEAVGNQCQGPRNPFFQLPEVTDIFCDCVKFRGRGKLAARKCQCATGRIKTKEKQ